MKKQVLGIPKLPVSETDRRARKPGLFKGSKFMSVYYISRQLAPPRSPWNITFPDNLPHLEVRGTAPDGHKINNKN